MEKEKQNNERYIIHLNGASIVGKRKEKIPEKYEDAQIIVVDDMIEALYREARKEEFACRGKESIFSQKVNNHFILKFTGDEDIDELTQLFISDIRMGKYFYSCIRKDKPGYFTLNDISGRMFPNYSKNFINKILDNAAAIYRIWWYNMYTLSSYTYNEQKIYDHIYETITNKVDFSKKNPYENFEGDRRLLASVKRLDIRRCSKYDIKEIGLIPKDISKYGTKYTDNLMFNICTNPKEIPNLVKILDIGGFNE